MFLEMTLGLVKLSSDKGHQYASASQLWAMPVDTLPMEAPEPSSEASV